MTTSNRFKRPRLERDHPIRTWATLFQPPADHAQTPAAAAAPPGEADGGRESPWADGGGDAPGAGGPLADAVERGYRVINEYMRQGQTFAQGYSQAFSQSLSPEAWMNAAASQGASADMQQLAQRVMQYGWDFAGLWFEMWTRMAGNPAGWTAPSVPFPPTPDPARATADGPPPHSSDGLRKPARIAVSVVSSRPATATLELRPGAAAALVAHALRAEGADAPPIRDVTIASSDDGEAVTVRVVVGSDQPPGVYNGMIIDGTSNLPRGTLSLTIGSAETH